MALQTQAPTPENVTAAEAFQKDAAARRQDCLDMIEKATRAIEEYKGYLSSPNMREEYLSVIDDGIAVNQELIKTSNHAFQQFELDDLIIFALTLHPELENGGNAMRWLEQEGHIYQKGGIFRDGG